MIVLTKDWRKPSKYNLFIFSRMGTKTVEDEPNLNAFAPSLEMNKFKVLTSTDQIKELQTIIRDKDTNRYPHNSHSFI